MILQNINGLLTILSCQTGLQNFIGKNYWIGLVEKNNLLKPLKNKRNITIPVIQ